jgi:hypothetical protein
LKSIAVNIYVDKEILDFLKMKNHERKSRILLSRRNDENISVQYLKGLIEKKLTSLYNQPYKLRIKVTNYKASTLMLCDSDLKLKNIVEETVESESSLQVFVQTVPGVFPPLATNFAVDPLDCDTYTMVSFYAFHPIDEPTRYCHLLFNTWKPFKTLGRVYVAKEGVVFRLKNFTF